MMLRKSPAQARLMAAAAHTKGGYGGVPQSVGREFNEADAGTGMIRGGKGERGGDGHELGGKQHRADSRRHLGKKNPLEVKDYTD